MMRQRFAAANECPVAIRTRGTARNRGSDKLCDTKNAKRVRFYDPEMDIVPDYASVRECRLAQFPRSDAPKTSEYSYFMNTKNGAIHGHSCSYDKDNGQLILKNSKTHLHCREEVKPSNIPKASSKGLRFSKCRETLGHFDHRLLRTPPITKYEEASRGDIKDLTKNIRERPLLLSENVTPSGRHSSSSTFRDASENTSLSGNQFKEKCIFSAKRQRLRQWARNSICEVEKLHNEGVGLISSLLGRLYQKCDESDFFYLHDLSKGKNGNGCEAPISCGFKNLEEILNVSHRSGRDMEHPKICFGGYRDRVFLDQDAYFSGSPFTNYGTDAHFKDELTDLHISSKDHKSRGSHVENDLPLCLPFERYGYSSSCYPEELDGSCSPIECQRKGPRRILLKWGFEGEKVRVNPSIMNYEPAKIYSPLSTTWNVDLQRIVDHVPDGKTLCSPSLFSNYCLQYKSIQSYPSTNYFTSDFVPNFDGVKYSVLNTDISSLTFPSAPKCITLTEDSNAENIPYNSNMILSFGDQLWLKNKGWGNNPHSDFWIKCFQDTEFALENPSIFHTQQFPQMDNTLCSFSIPKEAPGEAFSFCSDDTISNHPGFLNFSSSLDSTVNYPLLVDNASSDWSDREVYVDDENKWNYIGDATP